MEDLHDTRLDIVLRWTAAWNRRDWAGVADTFAENGTNHSMMDEPVRGRDRVLERTRHVMERVQRIEISLVSLFAPYDGLVVAERIDACQRADGSWGRVPVAGFYEIRDGLIASKRDYYDRAQLLNAMGLLDGSLPVAVPS